MGGCIALTVRWSSGEELRTSCWTNILGSYFSTAFYYPETSEKWLKDNIGQTMAHRRADPTGQLEATWGNHPKLTMQEYGIIVIDYRDSFILSCNKYTSPDSQHANTNDSQQVLMMRLLYDDGLMRRIKDLDGGGEWVEGDKIPEVFSVCEQAADHGRYHFLIAEFKLPFDTYLKFTKDDEDRKCYDELKTRFVLTQEGEDDWDRDLKEIEIAEEDD